MKKFFIGFLVTLVIPFLVTSFSSASTQSKALNVVKTSIKANEIVTNIKVNEIRIEFNNPIKKSTKFSNISLWEDLSSRKDFSVSISGKVLVVKLKKPLKYGSKYDLLIPDKSVADLKGNNIQKTYDLKFSTVEAFTAVNSVSGFEDSVIASLKNFDDSFCIMVKSYESSIYNADIIKSILKKYPIFDFGYNSCSLKVLNSSEKGSSLLLFNIKYKIPHNDIIKMQARISAKVKQILSEVLKPDMVFDWQKEKAIYDYIYSFSSFINTGAPNLPFTADTEYGVVVDGKGTYKGYAKAFYRLCNAAGIKTDFVAGTYNGKESYWNIVLLDGEYYHVDAGIDNAVKNDSKDTEYKYFNLTDSDMETDHGWNKTSYPKANLHTYSCINIKILEKPEIQNGDLDGNLPENSLNGGMAASDGDWVYYAGSAGLCKSLADGSRQKVLYPGSVGGINIYKGWIYFINYNDSWKIYKIAINGKGCRKLLEYSHVSYLHIHNGTVYFSMGGDIMVSDLNGNKADDFISAISISFYSGNIYYSKHNPDFIYIANPGGSVIHTVGTDRIERFVIDNGWIYYSNWTDNKCNIYRVSIETYKQEKICDDSIYSYFLVIGDYIYYSNDSDSGKIYRIKRSGEGKEMVCDVPSAKNLSYAGDSIYFSSMSTMYKFNVNEGSVEKV